MKRNFEPFRGWNRTCSEDSTWGREEGTSYRQSLFSSPLCPPLCLLSTHFFRVYLNSLITHLMINQKGHLKTQNYLTLKWIEVTAASVSQSMPKSAPTQDLMALQRKVKLTEYYWYFLTLFWVACRCFWYMGLPALFLLNVLMRSGGRAGEERRGEADTCSASKEGWVLGVQEKDGEGKAPWSCCFSVCIL